LGICYWAPDWISTNQFGSPWENQTLFDFDGELLDAISVFDNSNAEIKSVSNFRLNNIYNYPNPFNPITNLRYDLSEDAFVRITVFDILGNIVRTFPYTNQYSGSKLVQWDARNNQGESVSAGVYIYKIQAGDLSQTKKMILLK
tara:strand:+ start:919 stop:1350 length:432 start_codon:yes stop_codon:yes gene_type:complete